MTPTSYEFSGGGGVLLCLSEVLTVTSPWISDTATSKTNRKHGIKILFDLRTLLVLCGRSTILLIMYPGLCHYSDACRSTLTSDAKKARLTILRLSRCGFDDCDSILGKGNQVNFNIRDNFLRTARLPSYVVQSRQAFVSLVKFFGCRG